MSTENTTETPVVEVEAITLPALLTPERAPVLAGAEVTKEVLAKVKGFRGMILAAPDDKVGYDKIVAARQYTKKVISNIKSGCKTGRAPSIKEQEDWISLERELVSEFEPTLRELEQQEKVYEAEKAKKDAEKAAAKTRQIQERLDLLSDIGEKADYVAATTLNDEQWTKHYEGLRAKWVTRTEEAIAAEAKRFLGLERQRQLAQVGVEVEAAAAAELPDENFLSILNESTRIFDKAQAEEKRLDDQYTLRVAALAKLGVAVTEEDKDAVRLTDEEAWTSYLQDETNAYNQRQAEDAERTRLNDQLAARIETLGRAGLLWDLSTEEMKTMGDDAFEARFQYLKDADDERQMDERLERRLTALEKVGVTFDQKGQLELAIVAEDEYLAFLDIKTVFWNQEQEQKRKDERHKDRLILLGKYEAYPQTDEDGEAVKEMDPPAWDAYLTEKREAWGKAQEAKEQQAAQPIVVAPTPKLVNLSEKFATEVFRELDSGNPSPTKTYEELDDQRDMTAMYAWSNKMKHLLAEVPSCSPIQGEIDTFVSTVRVALDNLNDSIPLF